MKRLVCLAVLLTGAALLFAAGSQEEAAGGLEGVTINFSSWLVKEGASEGPVYEMAQRFEESHPGIKVNYIGIPYEQTQQQIMIAVSGGNAPDIIQLSASWAVPLATRGALLDLKPYFPQDKLRDIPEAAYDAGVVGDKLISIPWQLGTIAVLAWKDAISKAGYPVEIPETWAEFKEVVAKISQSGVDVYGFGARTDKSTNSAFWFFPAMWGHGGRFEDASGKVAFNNPGTVAALGWYKEIGTTKQTPVGMGVREVRNLMPQGKLGFIFDGPWMKGILRNISGMGETIDDKYITGKFPKAPDGKRYGIGNNHVLSISAESKVTDQAVALIRYFTEDPEITKYYYHAMGAVPVYRTLLADPLYQTDPFAKTFAESAEFADCVPSKNPNFEGALEFVAVAMQDALLGGDPARAAATAQRSIAALYGQ
ncbi:MAG: sugar ABC transporter substrate-binding protein [Spirochaetales bacterium]|nr:sugar ABC transporter substrate-binding protein [Spirochaetales bacterium]